MVVALAVALAVLEMLTDREWVTLKDKEVVMDRVVDRVVVGTSYVGEGEWQGDRVWVIVEVWEAQVEPEKDWVGVKVWDTEKAREPLGLRVSTLGVGDGEAALGDTGALTLPLPVATETVEEGEPTVMEAGGDWDTVPLSHWETLVVGH